MKIGIVCYPTYGGSGALAAELGKELAKRGNCVHFISYGLPFRINRNIKNVFFHEVEVMNYPLFRYPPYTLSLSVKISEIFEEQNLDILHVHYAMPHATSAYLAKRISCNTKNKELKFITTLHGTDITLVGNHHSFFKITKFSIESSNGITAVSNYLKDLTITTFDIKEDRIKVIYNFVDTEVFKKDFNKSDYQRKEVINKLIGNKFLEKKDKVISHISNFRPVKNVQNIIKAFSKISKAISAKCLLVGDGPEISLCKELCKKLGVEKKVIFLGILEDIKPVLNASDLYLLPSKSESFGLSALEALSFSIPVIGTKVGGLKEVVFNGKCGYLINPDNFNEIAEKSLEILADENKYLNMAQNARDRALAFDCNIIIPEYINYYKTILI